MSAQKKRKSTNLLVDDSSSGPQPSKKEKPWYTEKAEAESHTPSAKNDRRKSFLGGLLKRMRSSSTMLKDKNQSGSMSQLVPSEHAPLSRLTSTETDSSFRSESSQESCEGIPAAVSKNASLLRFVEQKEADPIESDLISYSTTSQSSLSQMGSVDSLCTPSRADFHRGNLRSSSRSMPGEDSYVLNSICNSVQRVKSSASDSAALQRSHFLRKQSVRRLGRPPIMGGSMADLPEECDIDDSEGAFSKLNESQLLDEYLDDPQSTPIPSSQHNDSFQSHGSRKSKSRLRRVASRLLGSNRRTPITGEARSRDKDYDSHSLSTPNTRQLSRNNLSSTSLQQKVKQFVGFGSSNTNLSLNGDEEIGSSKVRRAKTDVTTGQRDKNRDRRFSDVGFSPHLGQTSYDAIMCMDERKRSTARGQMESKKNAQIFADKVRVAEKPIEELLKDSSFDAILVDLSFGKPVSNAAKYLYDESAEEITRRLASITSNFEEIIKRPGKPTLVVVNRMDRMGEDGPWPLDRKVRHGVGSALRTIFKDNSITNILLHPVYCTCEDDWNSELLCLDPVLTVVHTMLKMSHPETFENVTIAGVDEKNVSIWKEHYDDYMATHVTPMLDPPCENKTTQKLSPDTKQFKTTEADV